ncbi:unnamed protein product [Psylliodes chrysocephalus]|uniref:DUF659 domain-containing protein n=1 Tax=Psylliodes chrysocephalus TaxID=3402493 RepID=A0A9P0DAN3_9CUCU|nr:unnamed protein product [Psylliodes chrysocephala]
MDSKSKANDGPLDSKLVIANLTSTTKADAAAYMLQAAINLKIFYPKLIHCTCVAHRVNRIAEEIRNLFPLVNHFINYMKKVFLKAPLRVQMQMYKEKLPGVPLPPKLVITRWETGLEAVFSYFEHCDEIQLVMSEFNDNISEAIREAKKILKNPKLKQQLAYINGNYKLIVSTITLLERQEVNLCE